MKLSKNTPDIYGIASHDEPKADAENSMCSTCHHQFYCACRGKTGYCGNYTNKAARVRDGRFSDPVRVNP